MTRALKRIGIRVVAILLLSCSFAVGASMSTNLAFTSSTAYARQSRTDRILDDMYNEFRKFLRDTQRDWYNHQRNVTKDAYAIQRKVIRERRELEAETIDFRYASANDFNRFANSLTDYQYAALQKLAQYASDIGIHEVPFTSNSEYLVLKGLCSRIDGYRIIRKSSGSRGVITVERY